MPRVCPQQPHLCASQGHIFGAIFFAKLCGTAPLQFAKLCGKGAVKSANCAVQIIKLCDKYAAKFK